MSIGADPITSAVVTLAGVNGLPLLGFMVRKEAKGHGTQRFIEGPVQPGDDVAIVEDVVTTGCSVGRTGRAGGTRSGRTGQGSTTRSAAVLLNDES